MRKRTGKFMLIIAATLTIIIVIVGCENSNKKQVDTGSTNKVEQEQPKEETNANMDWESITGYWEGAIEITGQQSLLIQVTVEAESGVIAIPAQGISNYPLTNVSTKDDTVYFEMALPGQLLTFDGKREQDRISGTFEQNGQRFPFYLTIGTKEEEVASDKLVEIDVEGGTLIGQLELPGGEAPYPVAIIIAGSGPTDRNGNSLILPGKNNSLQMIAEQLAAEGVASIRYDKRGVGMNSSLVQKEEDVSFDLFAADTAKWLEFARADERFSQVGIVGHSEGSLVGLVAAEMADTDFFISLAGAGRSIDHVLLEQLSSQLPEQLLKEAEAIIAKLKAGEVTNEVSPELAAVFRSSVQPYLISWMKYDPAQLMKQMTMPILIVNGTHDMQVAVAEAEVLHQAQPEATLSIIEGMNHVLKETTMDPAEQTAALSDPDLPLAKQLVESIGVFLQEQHIGLSE